MQPSDRNSSQALPSVQGPAGNIESWVAGPLDGSQPIAVLCHPHPLYGGSMYDGVLATIANALAQQQVSTIRFNFRGVGASDGISGRATAAEKNQTQEANRTLADTAPCEVADLAAVILWLEQQLPQSKLWLAGYSFGAAVIWYWLQTANHSNKAQQALLIAPPTTAMALPPNTLAAMPISIDIAWGDADDYVDPASLQALSGVNLHTIAGANHFFLGRQSELMQVVALHAARSA